MYRELIDKRVLILGCGNVLLGDDGFGPAVIKRLRQRYELPEDVHAEDVGTSVRDLLFNLSVLDRRPDTIIILDAANRAGRRPGEVFQIPVEEIPEQKVVDYSFHQFPTTNLLKEIRDCCGVQVILLVAQTAGELEEVQPGLSPAMAAAVREAADRVMELLDGCRAR